ncbi:hypothetical protein HZA96_02400 [Candidatus Woesearchaeota archaeon]|nr:hypothetical protein [Candidatus Woesearchaeota archaeon]
MSENTPNTPLQILEIILAEVTGQQPNTFLYQPHPANNFLYVVCKLSDITEVHPYVLARFDNRTLYQGNDSKNVAPFFEKVGTDIIYTKGKPIFQIFDEFVFSLADPMSQLSQLSIQLTPETSYAYIWDNDDLGDKLSNLLVYAAPKASVMDFLAAEERKGDVKYNYWSIELHYELQSKTSSRQSLSPQQLSGSVQEIREAQRRLDKILPYFEQYEAALQAFAEAVNKG